MLPIMRFEKIWIEQCRATRAIKRRFGANDDACRCGIEPHSRAAEH
jgi:hypothetical protein